MSSSKDFPADNPSMAATPGASGEAVDRRVFIGAAMGGVGLCYLAAIGYPVYRYLASPVERAEAQAAVTEVTLPEAHKLPRKSALMFKFGPFTALLIHHEDGTWSAFNAKCTHLGCTVKYEPHHNRIFCECHGGIYDAKSGANTGGPPPRPLQVYQVKVSESGVVVSKS
ncbi:MAG: Rieske (2Fe-2S) protein [Verrucomicrobiae bacterium]|nr:Rieske (2Fe-2S) protein [Verrucomicrobiae bacterium]